MKVIKYKKKPNGKYSVFLDDGRELVLYEEVILKYNLLITKEVLENDLLEIYQYNLFFDVYYIALKSIKNRMKSTYELRTYLIKKDYPMESIDQAIALLTKQGYLNDRSFAKSYINNQIFTTTHGPLRIKGDLINKKISSDIIDEELASFTEEMQLDKITRMINKMIKGNKTRGGVVLKRKIANDLKLLGYDYSLIEKSLSNNSFDVDNNIARKEYDKLYKKYSTKYDGNELKRKIREKMYQKGLMYEEEW